ncbi:MAG: hypothetical protein Kow0092_35490 [Deferrisomatales bacterium]
MRVVFVACVALLGVPAAAGAGLYGTAHDIDLGNGAGPCFVCHVPHQASGEMFWAKEPVYEGKVGTAAALCATCHHSGEGYGALMTRAHSDDYVYGPGSHGQKMSLENPPPGTDVLGSGLPRIDTRHGIFECTTCHSVHDDTYRPFLQDEPNALCARCHRLRHYVAGLERSGAVVEAGRWGVGVHTGPDNPGSHPVGADVTGEGTGGPALTIPRIFRTPFSPEPGKWSLGGHLTEGDRGGVSCLTCHAVHGVQPDPDDVVAAVGEAPPGPGFLVVPQPTASLGSPPRPVPNGDGGTSALCEACHGVDNNPAQAPGGAPWADDRHRVSPGPAGTFSHPVDSYPSSAQAGVGDFPPGWPRGDPSLAGSQVEPVPVCESCHAPHPAAALEAGRGDVDPGAGPYLLRAPLAAGATTGLCARCHTAGMPHHHPVGATYDSTGVSYLANARGGPADTLTCSTCHTGAHGWPAPSWVSLDPAWLPRDNGRSLDQAADMYHPDMSKTCMDCHYFMDGDGASVSPTLGSRQTVIRPGDDEYDHYQTPDRSMGTHYIGRIHEGETNWRQDPLLDLFDTTATWKEQNHDGSYADGLADGWSRFGGEDRDGERVLVCESCHELEPDRNRGFAHLLLAPYEEGRNGVDEYPGDADGRDILCEACHGVPHGSHPLTGDSVSGGFGSRPMDLGGPSMLPEVLGHATVDRSRGALSCDSCHQPHDANTHSYTFILDVPEQGPIGAYTATPVEAGPLDPAKPSEHSSYGYYRADGTRGTYTTPTLTGRGGPHVGLCKQCHRI